jgi:hypothetical protein
MSSRARESIALRRSPDVMAGLHLRYLRDAKDSGIAFRQFLESIGVGNPADEMDGPDDARWCLATGPAPSRESRSRTCR